MSPKDDLVAIPAYARVLCRRALKSIKEMHVVALEVRFDVTT